MTVGAMRFRRFSFSRFKPVQLWMRLSCSNLNIFWPIVSFITVDVVDYFP
jgi:hypothetical protein